VSGLSFSLEENRMARSIDRRFYESTEWKRCKEVYLEKVNHLCERCLAKGIYEPAKIVHHKVYLTAETFGDPELMYGFDNLEALCLACHNEEHGRTKQTRRWKFVDGELVTSA
jgi:5-methylcytosine-specific restriction endonuclease McrA